MKLVASALSDTGRVRRANEDSLVANERLGLFIVADGMGGHRAGEVASRMAADLLSAEVARQETLLEDYAREPGAKKRRALLALLETGVKRASRAIFDAGEQEESRRGMGTTLTALLIAGPSAFVAHAGDSRLYLLRDGELHALTEDHTLLNEQVKKGLLTRAESQALDEYRNVITRGLGLMPALEVDTLHIELAEGDRFLLCSDGLTDMLDAKEIAAMLKREPLDDVTRRLIELANRRGGKDNITAVAVEATDLPQEAEAVEARRKLTALRQIDLFSKLSYPELVKALNITQLTQAAPDQLLIREDEVGDCLYILVQGVVDVFKDGIYLTTLERGAHFGEMALVSRAPRSATVRTAAACRLLVISRADFFALLDSEPALAVKILLSFVDVLSKRLADTSRAFSDWRRRFIREELSH